MFDNFYPCPEIIIYPWRKIGNEQCTCLTEWHKKFIWITETTIYFLFLCEWNLDIHNVGTVLSTDAWHKVYT